MNFQNTNNNLKIVLSVGDESGIGPEVILKALYSYKVQKNIDFILVGSKKNLQNNYAHLKSLGLKNIANPNNFQIYDLKFSLSNSKPKSSYGDSSFNYLIKAIEIASVRYLKLECP